MKVQAREDSPDMRCALCHGALEADVRTCERCGTMLHAECLESLRRCPTLGCGPSVNPAPAVVVRSGARPRRSWFRSFVRLAVRLFIVGVVVAILGAALYTSETWPFSPVRSWPCGMRSVSEIFFARQDIVAAVLGDEVRVWSLADGHLIARHKGEGTKIAISPDGQLLAFGQSVVTTERQRLRFRLEAGREPVAFSPDGKCLLIQGSTRVPMDPALVDPAVVSLEEGWDALSRSRDASVRLATDGQGARVLSWSPHGDAIAGVVGPEQGARVQVWDSHSGAILGPGNRAISTPGKIVALTWASEGELLVLQEPATSPRSDMALRLSSVEAATGSYLRCLEIPYEYPVWSRSWPTTYALSPTRIAVQRAEPYDLAIYSTADGSLVSSYDRGGFTAIQLSPDERFVAVGAYRVATHEISVDVLRVRGR